MKWKIITPLLAVIVGVFVGYLIFGGESENKSSSQTENSAKVWTCSMHPQIRKDGPGKCPICEMDLIPLEQNSNDNPLQFSMTTDAMKIANIQTTIINGEGTNETLVLSGKIKTDETFESSLVSHIPGRIEKLYISFEGQKVSKGQRIAKIYAPDLIIAQKELLEAYKMKEDSPKLLEAAKNKLRYWKISNKEINGIIKLGRTKEYFDIYAEHSGVISQKKVAVGDYLSKGKVMFQLQNLSNLWAVFDVYERDLERIAIGDEIRFTTPALPGTSFLEKVVFVDPIINPSTRTGNIRLSVSNKSKSLKPEMFITGKLRGKETIGSKLLVPKSAILWTGERSVAYVKLKDMEMPTFEFREVEIGQSIGQSYEVLSGLFNGDEVVTNGAFVIDASAQLNNRSSMMNRTLLTKHSDINVPQLPGKLDHSAKVQIESWQSSYLELKDLFVKSDASSVAKKAAKLLVEIEEIDMSKMSSEGHEFLMEVIKTLKPALKSISDSKSVDDQRKYLNDVSLSIIRLNKSFNLNSSPHYIQYCPMANNDSGGYWLSDEEKIRNPFYGSSMLSCGEVLSNKQSTTGQSSPSNHNH
jgi:Cu(I)/Ag(I) efflux system membrane fusion protein